MDWVGWYYLFWWIAGFGLNCYYDGQPKDSWSASKYLLGTVICMPYIGRIFGWW